MKISFKVDLGTEIDSSDAKELFVKVNILHLVPMVEFIIGTEKNGISNFLTESNIPKGLSHIQLVLIKKRLYVEYAKFLYNKLTVDWLIMLGFTKAGLLAGNQQYSNGDATITQFGEGFFLEAVDVMDGKVLLRIQDLAFINLQDMYFSI